MKNEKEIADVADRVVVALVIGQLGNPQKRLSDSFAAGLSDMVKATFEKRSAMALLELLESRPKSEGIQLGVKEELVNEMAESPDFAEKIVGELEKILGDEHGSDNILKALIEATSIANGPIRKGGKPDPRIAPLEPWPKWG